MVGSVARTSLKEAAEFTNKKKLLQERLIENKVQFNEINKNLINQNVPS